MAKRITKTNSRYLCKSVKEKIRKNLALFALSKSYNDILDVDRKEDIMKVKVNNKFDDKMNAKPRVFNYNCDCK